MCDINYFSDNYICTGNNLIYIKLIFIKECSLGCSLCGSNAVDNCYSCQQNYYLRANYCCPDTTPYLRDFTCVIDCGSNYYPDANGTC